MPLTVILSVGQDVAPLKTRKVILEGAGYLVESALSVNQAAKLFLAGDFDIVILCHSIPTKDREHLTSLIRASGSLIPVVSVSTNSGQCDAFTDATIDQDPKEFLRGIQEVLEHFS